MGLIGNPLARRLLNREISLRRIHRSTALWGLLIGVGTALLFTLPSPFSPPTWKQMFESWDGALTHNGDFRYVNLALFLSSGIWTWVYSMRHQFRAIANELEISQLEPRQIFTAMFLAAALAPLGFAAGFSLTVYGVIIMSAASLVSLVSLIYIFLLVLCPQVLLISVGTIFTLLACLRWVPTRKGKWVSAIPFMLFMVPFSIISDPIMIPFVLVLLIGGALTLININIHGVSKPLETDARLMIAYETHIAQAFDEAWEKLVGENLPPEPDWEILPDGKPKTIEEKRRWLMKYDPDSMDDDAMMQKWGCILELTE